ENGIIRIDGSKISDIGNSEDILNNPDGKIIDAEGKWVLPGFIDIHCHGGKGCDVMDGKFSDIETIAKYHASGGTTAFLPTTASSSIESILQALDAIHQARVYSVNGAKVIGAHIEGPYFCYAKRGCHLPKFVRNPRPQEYNRMLEFSDDIASMTLAPELDGAEELIKKLVNNDILVSIGHSDATYAQVLDAVNWGARHVTHLYCAMSSLVKNGPVRISGVVESALLLDELTVEFIADGRHVPPELIRLAIKTKGIDKVCIVTDAMRGAGMPSGVYTFGPSDGQEVLVQDEIAIMPDRTGYASTVMRMKDLIKTLIDLVGLDLADAVKMASIVPAKIIGVDDQMGSLEKGKDANIVFADDSMEIHNTIINAEIFR
ncbi:MAG: N-acetylglucosamine-6-phosphate deacetylase, partial [Candidatus Poribacteria bacterium]